MNAWANRWENQIGSRPGLPSPLRIGVVCTDGGKLSFHLNGALSERHSPDAAVKIPAQCVHLV